jgi:cytochrome P450
MSDVEESPPPFPMARTEPVVPPPGYAKLRESPPCRVQFAYGDQPWLLSRYEDVRAGLANPHLSADTRNPHLPRVGPLAPGPSGMSFLRMDEPEHGGLRRMLTSEFTMRRISSMRPRIQEIVDRLLKDLEEGPKPADLMTAFALPLPSLVICELLGVPGKDHDFVKAASAVIASSTATEMEAGKAFVELAEYLGRLITEAAEQPGDNLLSRVATGYAATGKLGHDEFVEMARLIVVAGHETTAQMIGMSVVTLLRHPEQLAAFRSDEGLVRGAVDELLRYLSVTQYGVVRVAVEDIEIGGTHIAKNDGVAFAMSAANHDEAVFPDAGSLDIHRDASRHLAYGHGIHQCLGRPLANAEIEIALSSLFARFPDLRLAVDFADLPFRDDHDFVNGMDSVPVTW